MTRLIETRDAHFAWMLGEMPGPAGLRLADGGIESPEILVMLRGLTAALTAAECRGSWLIADDDLIVGLCSFMRPADTSGSAEIGYGIAEAFRRRGHASAAIGLMIDEVRRTGAASQLWAETSVDNPASQHVLIANGFAKGGIRTDADDGDVIHWSRDLADDPIA